MGRYDGPLLKTGLFDHMSAGEMKDILACLEMREKYYRKDEYIFRQDDEVLDVGVVLQGKAQVILEHVTGEKEIRTELPPGAMFAETFVCAGLDRMPVSVVAREDCLVAFIALKKIVTVCGNQCAFHMKIIENLLRILAGKNLYLGKKLDIVTQKTIREKLMAYLSRLASVSGSDEVTLTLSREDLADYLSVNRSALSREMSKMQEEGLVEIKQKKVILHRI